MFDQGWPVLRSQVCNLSIPSFRTQHFLSRAYYSGVNRERDEQTASLAAKFRRARRFLATMSRLGNA
jgi:hypothetical protein